MVLTLHTTQGHSSAFAPLVIAQMNNVPLAIKFLSSADIKSEAFLSKSPMGAVPVLETEQGFIFESHAIARYLARMVPGSNLDGATFHDKAEVDLWMSFCASELNLGLTVLTAPVMGHCKSLGGSEQQALKDVLGALKVLNNHLQFRTFLVGNSMTLADIIIASALVYPMKFTLDKATRKGLTNVERWYNTCVNQKAFKTVVGPAAPCKVSAGGVTAPKKKAKATKAPKAKKEEKKPSGPKDMKSFKEYLKSLPKAKFNFEEMKRIWMNDGRDALKKYISENNNEKEISIWTYKYKYNEDLKTGGTMWMNANQMTGFVSRCDAVRSHTAGTLLLVDDETSKSGLALVGVLIIVGTSMEYHMVSDDIVWGNPDSYYYAYDRVTPMDDAKLENVMDLFFNDEKLGNATIHERKAIH